MAREIERAREEVKWQQREQGAQLALAVSPAAAISLLPGVLARLRAHWPQLRVRVADAVYPRALTMVRGSEIDLAVGPLPPEGAGRDLRVAPLFDAQQLLVVRRGHPLAGARRLAELQQTAWVLTGPHDGPGDPRRLGFERLGLAVPPVMLECESFSTLLAVMPSVDAVGIMPAGFYDSYAASLGIVSLPIEDPLPHVTLHAVWRADVPLTAPAAHLLDSMEAESRGCARAGLRPGEAICLLGCLSIAGDGDRVKTKVMHQLAQQQHRRSHLGRDGRLGNQQARTDRS